MFTFDYFASVSLRLAKLLGVRYVPGSTASSGAVGLALSDVIRLHNEGRYSERDAECLRMALLAKHLDEVKAYDSALFGRLRRPLREGSIDDYYGARHEVAVASTLIRKGIPFQFSLPDRADFSFDGEVAIESTSVHLVRPKSGDLFYKVESKLRREER